MKLLITLSTSLLLIFGAVNQEHDFLTNQHDDIESVVMITEEHNETTCQALEGNSDSSGIVGAGTTAYCEDPEVDCVYAGCGGWSQDACTTLICQDGNYVCYGVRDEDSEN